jgi:hypothetical protein
MDGHAAAYKCRFSGLARRLDGEGSLLHQQWPHSLVWAGCHSCLTLAFSLSNAMSHSFEYRGVVLQKDGFAVSVRHDAR